VRKYSSTPSAGEHPCDWRVRANVRPHAGQVHVIEPMMAP